MIPILKLKGVVEIMIGFMEWFHFRPNFTKKVMKQNIEVWAHHADDSGYTQHHVSWL